MPQHLKDDKLLNKLLKVAGVGKADFVEHGRTGTSIFSGFIREDFNSEWQFPKSVDNVERMRRTSGLVRGLLQAMKLPILRAERHIEPGDPENSEYVKHAEFVEWNLFHGMEQSFDETLREALNFIDYGFWIFEKVWEKSPEDGAVYLKKLASRLPSALQKWETKNGEPGITQQLPTTDKKLETTTPDIPWNKLVVLSFQKEGDNHEGISILRASWMHYWYIDNLFRIQGIAAERHGAGTLKIKMPKSYNANDKTQAEDMGQNFRSNEQAFMMLPDGWDVEIITPNGSPEGGNINEAIDKHSKMMAISMLAQMVLLGMDSQGSYALSKDQTSFLLLGLQAIADQVADALNRTVIRDLIDYNFGPQDMYPNFAFGDIGRIDFGEYSTALTTLINGGLVTPDKTLEEFLRKQFRLPKAESLKEKLEQEEEEKKIKEEHSDVDEETPEEEKSDDEITEEDKEIVEDKTDEEEDEEEMTQKKNPRVVKFQEWKAPRELTFAEQRVNFAQASDAINRFENKMFNALRDWTRKQKDILFRKVEGLIRGENIAPLKELGLQYTPALKIELKTAAQDALNFGKQVAAKEIKVPVPQTPAFEAQVLNQEIDDAIEERNMRITNEVKNTARNAIKNGIGISAALLAASTIFDSEADKSNNALVGHFVLGPLNVGRRIAFEENEDKIYALQRSEILDMKTDEICVSLDGRVVDAKDPFAKMDQVHTNCRGIWVAALRKDEFLPPIKGIPSSIAKQFETDEGVPKINAFKAMKKPVVQKSSRAYERRASLPAFNK